MHEVTIRFDDVRVQFGALMAALLKARMFDAAEALWEWAEEWLDDIDIFREQFEEVVDLDDRDRD